MHSKFRSPRIGSRRNAGMAELDEADRKILAILQENSRVANVELASRVGLSPPTCLRRVRRLRTEGVIERDMAIVNPRSLGVQVSVVVEIVLDRARKDVVDAFRRKMLARPEISQCYLVTGEVDFVLIVQVASIAAYEAFLERALYSDPAVKTVTSLVVVNRVKFEPRIAIADSVATGSG